MNKVHVAEIVSIYFSISIISIFSIYIISYHFLSIPNALIHALTTLPKGISTTTTKIKANAHEIHAWLRPRTIKFV